MENAMSQVVFLLSIAAGAIFLYGPWQTYCVDRARQRMFEVRDKLFDMAANGELSFSDPVYRELRLWIELNIRFAHKLAWPRLIAYHIFASGLPKLNKPLSSRVRDSINSVKNEESRSSLLRFHGTIKNEVVNLLLMRSPGFVGILLIVLGAYMLFSRIINRRVFLDAMVKRVYDEVQADAERSDQVIGRSGQLARA